jgi:short-subunit dehydrogenase
MPVTITAGLAVVTGASSGIGAALAREFAARGLPLLLTARRYDRLEELAAQLHASHGVSVDVRRCDLADRERRFELCDELAAREVAVLCNAARFATVGELGRTDPNREAKQIELNVVAMHELTMAVLPGMLARRAGEILIAAPANERQPLAESATHAASQAFAITFAHSLHTELQGTGVTCTLLTAGQDRADFASASAARQL